DVGVLAAGWHTYWTTLDPSGLDDCNRPDTPLTAAQASAALAGFDQMFVYTFYNDSSGPSDHFNLDNASLSGPQSPVTPPSSTVTRKFTLIHHRRTFLGTLTAADDFSCAGKTNLTIFRKAKKPVKVGTATTSAPNLRQKVGSAKFSFKLKKVVKGSYYASAMKAKSPLDGNTCNAAHSNSISVR